MREEATAFVPGHVTGFFSAHPHEDPTKAGSRGAGLTLTDGVEVTVRPVSESADEPPTIVLDGEETAVEPVATVLEALGVSARVEADADLPLGAGFGVSGAMALGTALAANRAFDRKLSQNELVTIAHGAEVRAETGLGDVVAQAQGGVPIRLEPGGPQVNELDAIPARARVEYVAFGELSTAAVLSGDTDRLTEAGTTALSRVVEEPTLLSFVYASRAFAREAGLLTDRVAAAIEDVADAGGQASMAMLGDTVFALGTGLSDAGYDPAVCATHPAGAMLR
ncbi:pantoate kinase [Natrarchaeobius oligotrophus]|uniref:Pantoate kinase n=1 Tax=Natrarchaeobius chitinivorans TaxID=1679083 RepID=A0A3N6MDJ4_NATCH|nr:pantoate kinase [Natrarchaeobius chitinivorans]RQH01939.1 sugar kinase [Natrarchaeobius chitinivorans]